MKKSWKKRLGILLTASITAATVFPTTAGMAKANDGTPEKVRNHTTATADGLNTVSANLPADVTNGSLPTAASYDIDQPVIESFEMEENGQTLNQNDTLHFKMSAYDAESGIKSVTVTINHKSYSFSRSVTLENSGGNLYTGTISCRDLLGYEGNYYISRILVEDYANNYTESPILTEDRYAYLYTFTLTNQGTLSVSNFQIQKNTSNADGTLGIGDTVTYTAHVDCEGMELREKAEMLLETAKSGEYKRQYADMVYHADTQTVTGTFTITADTYPAEWNLVQVRFYAVHGTSHLFSPAKIEPDNNLTFTVSHNEYDFQPPVIESITLDKDGQTVKAGDTLTLKIKVNEKNPSSQMDAIFTTGKRAYTANLNLDPITMEYTGTIKIISTTYPAKWDLTIIYLSDTYDNRTQLSDFSADCATNSPWYFTVDPEGYVDQKDTVNPVIEDITIDKNGQWVQPGDTVTMTVKVKEENPSSYACATFRPQVSNVSGISEIGLYYNADTKEYTGSITIASDTYPCEWKLTDLSVTDQSGNKAYIESYREDFAKTYPWYYMVKSGDTYREDMKNVTFTFYGLALQEDGSYQYGSEISSQTVENVGRRNSLKELGVSLPKPVEGLTAIWTDVLWNTQTINEDTVLLFEGSDDLYYLFNATYDKGCANVKLTYMTKDSGIKTVTIPQFTGKESTYREVLDALPLPEDARTDGFSGYKLKAGTDETAQVGDIASLYAEAEYNNCQVAWHTKYLDENGNEKSDIIPASYEKGTTVNEALAALTAKGGPEGIPAQPESPDFETWVLTDTSGEDVLSQPMTDLYVTAVYRGKTTVDAAYTYRGEDGALTCGGGLMLMDGENLSDTAILGEATNAFKNVNHLEGLLLQEWTGSMETDLGRYKKVSFRALYRNCAVILKYPDSACQYIVVPKGSPFTLPTENETYTDILWEGCTAGETVTITADREFLVADAKPKDGSADKPDGEKPSQNEIDKIIDEINHTENGGTVRVDMKKATVVPKEVLEAIQGKEVNIVLDMGAYCWSIGGTDVLASNLKDTDLEVTIGTNAIPPALVDSLAEGKPSTQLSLTHNGEFGFRADLTLNLGGGHAGGTGNLYYYDSSGKLVYRNAGEIGADGTISLSFSHASDYVIIIDRAPAGNESNGSGSEDREENNGSEEQNENNGSEDREENDGSEDLGVSPPADQSNSQRQTAPDGNNGDRNGSGTDTGRLKSPKTGE